MQIKQKWSLVGALVFGLLIAACSESENKSGSAAPAPGDRQEARLGGVLVIGGTRGVGLEMVRELNARDEKVVVLVRPTSETEDLEVEEVPLIEGDAMDRPSIDAAVASDEFRIVVSTVSGRTPEGERVDGKGNINIINAAKAAGVERFVLISTIGAGDSREALSEDLQKVLGSAIEAKEIAENHLRRSGLKYTIIRPGGLDNRAPSGKGVLLEDPAIFGSIGRTELAKLIVESMYDETSANKTFAAVEVD